MSNDLVANLNNAINQKAELSEEEKKEIEQLRAIHAERVRRYRQRRKLKDAAADFLNRLQLYTVNHLDKNTMTVINVTLRNILKLRPHWTDADLKMAFNSLRSLEQKYLGQAKSKVPDEKLQLKTKLTKEILQSDIKDDDRLEIILDILDNVAKKLAAKGETLAPTREHTLALLTQNLSNAVPTWFEDALLKLLAEKYTGNDLFRILSKFRQKLTEKKIIEGTLAAITRQDEEEE